MSTSRIDADVPEGSNETFTVDLKRGRMPRNMRSRFLPATPTFFLAVLLLAAMACTVPEIGSIGLGGGGTPTTPTTLSGASSGNFAGFFVPLYSVNLGPGDKVPGTQLEYFTRNNDAYDLLIDGRLATKRSADSLPWTGLVGPGVAGRFNLRLVPQPNDRLLATGTVNLTILNPIPVETMVAPDLTNALNYRNILLEYSITAGQQIPGTTLIFVGEAPQGAELSGSERHPYYAELDSVVWNGMLRENVYMRQTLRVIRFDSQRLSLAGTAEVWVIRN